MSKTRRRYDPDGECGDKSRFQEAFKNNLYSIMDLDKSLKLSWKEAPIGTKLAVVIVFTIIILLSGGGVFLAWIPYAPWTYPLEGGIAFFLLFQLPWTIATIENRGSTTIKGILGFVSIFTVIILLFRLPMLVLITFFPFMSLNVAVIVVRRRRKAQREAQLERLERDMLAQGKVKIIDEQGESRWVTPSEALAIEQQNAREEEQERYAEKVRWFVSEVLEGKYGYEELMKLIVQYYKYYKDVSKLGENSLRLVDGKESELVLMINPKEEVDKLDVLRLINGIGEETKNYDYITIFANKVTPQALDLINNSATNLRFYQFRLANIGDIKEYLNDQELKKYNELISSRRIREAMNFHEELINKYFGHYDSLSLENMITTEFTRLFPYLSNRYGELTKPKVRLRKPKTLDFESLIVEATAKDFEQIISKLFETMGYEVENLPHIGDYGADVIAKRGNEIIAIQCKKYSYGNNVGAPEVQKALGSMWRYNANKAILITTSDFTVEAQEQAKNAPIELWNLDKIVKIARRYSQDRKQRKARRKSKSKKSVSSYDKDVKD